MNDQDKAKLAVRISFDEKEEALVSKIISKVNSLNNTITINNSENKENVKVAVRVRPLDEKEELAGCEIISQVDSLNRTITIKNPLIHNDLYKSYKFDYVFGTATTQLEVYSETARPIVDSVIEGYNGTIFAYGQTGTGKTYTMSGLSDVSECHGIVPNAFSHIFRHINNAPEEKKFLVYVSYMEIYNEEVRDLINNKGNLEIRERPGLGVYVEGLTGFVCRNGDEIDKILFLGNENRVTGATAMNDKSSRSHAILTIMVESSTKCLKKQRITQGKLRLIDLAGSERQNKSNSSGLRLLEATKVNYSLSVLGNVISALVDGKSTHIPYRNSKLTRLLQDSLGGNSKTVMLATISSADRNYQESVWTLRYAARAKNITNCIKINEDPKDAMLRNFEKQIDQLQKQLLEVSLNKIAQVEDGIMEHESEIENPEVKSEMVSAKREELHNTIREQWVLQDKITDLQQKILIGGENLVLKAQAQEKLLEAAMKELEERRRKEEKMMNRIHDMEAECLNIEKCSSSLFDESESKSKKLNKLIAILNSTKADLVDLQNEQQKEFEDGLEQIRSVSREIQLVELVINKHVPEEYYELIQKSSTYNDDTDEWKIKDIPQTRSDMPNENNDNSKEVYVTRSVYLEHKSLNRPKRHKSVKKHRSNVTKPTKPKNID